MSRDSQAAPELPRSLACAISLKAKELEGREQPAALFLVPSSRTLVALRHAASNGKGNGSTLKVTLARHTAGTAPGGDGAAPAVQGKAAVHLTVEASPEGVSKLVRVLVHADAGAGFYTLLLNCATLEELLSNRLAAAAARLALTYPTKSSLFPYCRECSAGMTTRLITPEVAWVLSLLELKAGDGAEAQLAAA